MFMRSAAADTRQGKAIQAVNEKWGEDFRQWGGRETIGIPVCKKKYAPFCFPVVKYVDDGGVKRQLVTVQRMYGCHCHSDIRRAIIEQHGTREGWEPFGQWSMRKAQEAAAPETERLNKATVDGNTSEEGWSSSSDEEAKPAHSICNNGTCTWKVKSKYDDIMAEMHGEAPRESLR